MKHFQPHEFICPHCGSGFKKMDTDLLQHLDAARHMAGIPFTINSAYRCEEHNKAVGGVPGSAHTKGAAVDISTPDSTTKFKVVESLINRGIKRLGIYETHVHIDVDKSKPQEVIW